MRTYDLDKAQLFIIPLRVGANLIYRGLRLQQVVKALANHSHWNHGHGHVIIALNTVTFSYVHRSDVIPSGFTKSFHQFFANATVVKAYDDFACAKFANTDDVQHEYKNLFAESKFTMSRYGFSLGLLAEPLLPYVEASYNHTLSRSNFLFYRTRPEPSFHNSTPYRHAPLKLLEHTEQHNNSNSSNNNKQQNTSSQSQSQQSRLPQPSCIGFDMNATEWLQEFTNSKYCLAIRGDTPHTHALIRAVKVGCIPVVISDYYPVYAPTFVSTLDMTRFSVFIGEEDFMRDPEGTLRSLTTIPIKETQARLRELRLAQRVLLYDHPNSLFVQAFLKEALIATNAPPSMYSFV
jgi:hypothetical protein